MGSYEKAVQLSKLSGKHNDAEDDIKKFEHFNCNTGDVLYLHWYMQQNTDMYLAWCGLLDADVFCDSADGKSKKSNDQKKQGTWEGNNLVSALLYQKDLDDVKAGKHRTRSTLLEHFGGKEAFLENVALLKKKQDGGADEIGPFSQESLLGDYVEYEQAVACNTSLHNNAFVSLNKFKGKVPKHSHGVILFFSVTHQFFNLL